MTNDVGHATLVTFDPPRDGAEWYLARGQSGIKQPFYTSQRVFGGHVVQTRGVVLVVTLSRVYLVKVYTSSNNSWPSTGLARSISRSRSLCYSTAFTERVYTDASG